MKKEKITDVSQSASEIILLGGKVMFAPGQTSSNGVTNGSIKNTGPTFNITAICFH